MTTLRIAHAEPRPGRLANGEFQTRGHLVVLADDAGHRAVPIWMGGDLGALYLADLLERPADQVVTDAVPQELTTRLLGAARARVTGVDIDVTEAGAAELSPEVTVARIGLAGPAGTRQVTADLGLGLALAAAAGAPVRLADAVLDRLAVPVPGDDLLTPFLDRVPPAPGPARPRAAGWPLATLPGRRPRYEPRNLDFADGLDRWDLDSGPGPAPDGEPDYAAAADGPPRSCPPPSRGPPGPPPWSRPSTPTTTAAPPSPSAARSASTPSPGRPGCAWRSSGTGGERGGPRGPRPHHRRPPPLDQVRDHGPDPRGRRPDPVRHRADRPGPDRAAEPGPAPGPKPRRAGRRNAVSADLSDGDLARLARGGDPVAFRLLVERHQAMVRARARQLGPDPGDVDDIVQESFLQAFLALDRLRDPDRFAGWLAGIVFNVCRSLHRRAPVTLLADWPEPLHPTSAGGLPSAEDLDRADALRAAVAGLPAGQRRAVTLHYYADVPAGQVAEAPGAARASLHKARLRLRAYLTEHRPDLVPVGGRT